MGLKIAPSTLGPNAGCGLFAVKPNPMWASSQQVMLNDASSTDLYAGKHLIFKPGKFIAPYIGEQLTEAEEEARYGQYDTKGRYLIQKGSSAQDRQYSIDAISTRTSPARYANHKNPASSVSAKFVTRQNNPWMVAQKRIFEGDEIFVNYGRDFELRDDLYPDEVRPKSPLCKSRRR